MTMTEVKVKQWGNSLGLIIPSEIVKQEELGEGDIIKIEVYKAKRVDAFGMFKGGPKYIEEDDEHGEF